MSVSRDNDDFKICIGARPQRAVVARKASDFLSSNEVNNENIDKALNLITEDVSFGTNMRGTKEYREVVSKVLVERAITEVI